MTKDELYLIKVFEKARALGDPTTEVDRYFVGRAAGQNDKSVDNIVRMLTQTNFLKKGEGGSIYLTPQGLVLVEELLKEL